jgi:hypothetical protein
MHWIRLGTFVGAMIVPAWAASAQYAAPGEGAPSKVCLNEETRETIKKLRGLNRPLTKDDPMMPFDPEYFVGKWNVEWDLPESVFGQAGTLMATLAIRHVEGCLYEGELAGTDPDGPLTANVQLVYDPMARYLVWVEAHSRGYTLIKLGPVGGDIGGYFTHFWEVPATKINGKSVRMQGFTFLSSPVNYRVRAQISVDGEPYVNYGNPWFTKQEEGVPVAGR